MQAYWILPNRDQNDDVIVNDGKDSFPLRKILDPKLRPDGFSHGVPTELLERCDPKYVDQILFAQRFQHWNGDQQIFTILSPAGRDLSGRVVYLGLLFILESNEFPTFGLSFSTLSKEDQVYAAALIHRMTSTRNSDSWALSVHELIKLPPVIIPATNVELKRSVVHFDTPKQISKQIKLHMTAITLLVIASLVGLIGVIKWHLN